MSYLIPSLNSGMNLRDSEAAVEQAETRETLGCDFGAIGEIRPMRAGLLTWTMPSDVIDAHMVYLGDTPYLFTTHSDGLRVTGGTYHQELIDAGFTGIFRVLPISGNYFVLSSSTLMKKWKPGWAATFQWGLNTPPVPTVAVGTSYNTTIDMFESVTGWSKTGGGTGGAIALDNVTYTQGAGSMKITCDKGQRIICSKAVTLDLSKFTTLGDLGQPFINISLYSETLAYIRYLTINFSCASDATFKKDYYTYQINLSGLDTANLVIGSINDQWGNYSWLDLPIYVGEFLRKGKTAGRGWATITAVQIIVKSYGTSTSGQAILNVDNWFLSGGGLRGTYQFAAAYQNVLGNYGPYSAYSSEVKVNGEEISLSNLVVDSDAQTVVRRMAVLSSNLPSPMVWEISDNISTTATYKQQDSALSVMETLFNNKKPPICQDMCEYQGRIFLAGTSIGANQIAYSETLMYEAFPFLNYLVMGEGENLYQCKPMGSYLAVRGKKAEKLIYVTGDVPAYWQVSDGAKQGAVTSRFFMDVGEGHVFASADGFYMSAGTGGQGYYMQKINPVVADFTQVFGCMAGNFAYIYFMDTSGVTRVLRIDFRLGKPVTHYVANIQPTCIFEDVVSKRVYYAMGALIYQFNGSALPLPVSIKIPEQFCGNANGKCLSGMSYRLTGGPLSFTLSYDGTVLTKTYSMPNRSGLDMPVSTPSVTGKAIGMTITGTTDFTLYLPLDLEVTELA